MRTAALLKPDSMPRWIPSGPKCNVSQSGNRTPKAASTNAVPPPADRPGAPPRRSRYSDTSAAPRQVRPVIQPAASPEIADPTPVRFSGRPLSPGPCGPKQAGYPRPCHPANGTATGRGPGPAAVCARSTRYTCRPSCRPPGPPAARTAPGRSRSRPIKARGRFGFGPDIAPPGPKRPQPGRAYIGPKALSAAAQGLPRRATPRAAVDADTLTVSLNSPGRHVWFRDFRRTRLSRPLLGTARPATARLATRAPRPHRPVTALPSHLQAGRPCFSRGAPFPGRAARFDAWPPVGQRAKVLPCEPHPAAGARAWLPGSVLALPARGPGAVARPPFRRGPPPGPR